MKLALNILIVLIGLFCAVAWGSLIFMPEMANETFLLTPEGDGGLSNIRSDIGTLFFSSAVGCLLGLRAMARHWLLVPVVVMGGAALGRVISIAVEGMTATSTNGLVIEVIFVLILLYAYRYKAAE